MGEISLAAGNRRETSVYYEKPIALEPKHISPYLRLIEIYEQKPHGNKQFEILQNLIQFFPEFEKGYIKLAHICKETGGMETAVDTLEKGLSKNPGSADLANNLAWLYLEGGLNLERSFELVQQAYNFLPNDAAVMDTLCSPYYKKNLFAGAVWIIIVFFSFNTLITNSCVTRIVFSVKKPDAEDHTQKLWIFCTNVPLYISC